MWDGLFVVADAAPEIDYPREEAHLRDWSLIGPWSCELIRDLGDMVLLRIAPAGVTRWGFPIRRCVTGSRP